MRGLREDRLPRAEGASSGPFEVVVLVPQFDGALCAETDPELFFPNKGDRAEDARKVCAACPARLPCLEWAMKVPERYGVWGGLSETERRNLRRRQDRAARKKKAA